MPNIDKFAKNTTFLRIIWKEVNSLASSFKKNITGVNRRQDSKRQIVKPHTRKKDRLKVDVNLEKKSEITPKGEIISSQSSP